MQLFPVPNPSFPQQRWQIADPEQTLVDELAMATELSPLLAAVLVNQGIRSVELAQQFLAPESQVLPSPLEAFPDLASSLTLLKTAIASRYKIAICGDYDADGMTSTALLLRVLRALDADVDYAIPSRMQEGYGINQRIVEEFAADGVKLVLTVDNGIAAYDPIARARELGLTVIITDHHDLPPQLPPANAILNPKLVPEDSPYRGLAGVGVAYVLATLLAQEQGDLTLTTPLLELFTLGTIADLAPLVGVNRRWLQRGLALLPHSRLAGVQALMQVSGCAASDQALKPDAIGFRLGPRINAVGRIGDPQTVIELLTTDDPEVAFARAMQCEQANQRRRQLCAEIEAEAIDLVEILIRQEQAPWRPDGDWVIMLVHPGWHHGVIGIVASRLVECYGLPVFIATYEDETQIRGSARGIPEFDVFAALQACDDALSRYGGHRAAGGFSLAVDQWEEMRSHLRTYAHQTLQIDQLKPLVTVDAQASFSQITWDLYEQINQLHPCGIGNPEPIFWTTDIEVVEQRPVGKDKTHLKLTLATAAESSPVIKAMAWRWGAYHPLPPRLDIAYRLRENTWNQQTTLELEILGIREPVAVPPVDQQQSAPILLAQADRGAPVVRQQVALHCPEPTVSSVLLKTIEWSSLGDWPQVLQGINGHILMYGYQRPYVSTSTLPGTVEYDRPSRPCDCLILWSLPPSWTHLRWLLALARPQQIYVRNHSPAILPAAELKAKLKFEIAKNGDQPLNLLNLGQQWWVAPSTIVSVFREIGYPCSDFPETGSLEQELKRLQRWYHCSANRLAGLT
ncbi:single-stranded-DNA-specific exonuclease RecJ [Acaryochloris sp. IP29b_bin.148]|uniref:single-stranded-DNA-specific exonuclease RecJ n=1 Tax=Acaryochloris sp. IP29b_bin.148 TaxID=2969218 RepID=UPI0026275303|nr:single-stranded-DNA-specific exonuclease RecJ [Acaryochloris sp. IP29b_bin.148]